ncbi:MAG: NAD-dependent epimerase/dehydratase family protein [Lewinella sp.]|nr:NAD-dependent epimerase/dehydratase family protein [Lewinella sp.]
MTRDTPILITGANGFLGSYITRRLLQAGYTHVRGLHLPGSPMELVADVADRVHWLPGDLLDYYSLEQAMAGVDTIIHCAAMVSFDARDRRMMHRVNWEGTANVVNAALHQQVRRLLHLSTVATLGRQSGGPVVDEKTPWQQDRDLNNYELTKTLAEQEVWRGQAEGLEVAVLYPTIVLGAGLWNHGSTQIIQYASGKPAFYPTGATGVVDVRDVAEGVLRTIERDQNGDRFVLNGANVTYRALLEQLSQAFGHAPPRYALPESLTRLMAWFEGARSWLTGSRPLLTRASIHHSFRAYQYSSQRSKEELGLAYRPLEATLEDAVASYLATNGQAGGVLAF